jgi:hypothetical protein
VLEGLARGVFLSKTAFKEKYRKIKRVCQGFAVIFVVFWGKRGVFRLK